MTSFLHSTFFFRSQHSTFSFFPTHELFPFNCDTFCLQYSIFVLHCMHWISLLLFVSGFGRVCTVIGLYSRAHVRIKVVECILLSHITIIYFIPQVAAYYDELYCNEQLYNITIKHQRLAGKAEASVLQQEVRLRAAVL